jgi:hypothetical protein
LSGVEEETVGARVVLDRMEVWQGTRQSPVQLDDIEEWGCGRLAAVPPCGGDRRSVADGGADFR